MLLLSSILLLFVSSHHSSYQHSEILGSIHLGYYYVTLQVGTPPRKQSVIIGTSSSITAFPCAGCWDCGQHMDSYFDYTSSSTSHVLNCTSSPTKCYACTQNQCRFYQRYVEGSSISGFYVEDYVQFGEDSERVKFVFGCDDSETFLFRTQLADGIMGLAENSRDEKTIIDAVYESQNVTSDVFSLCFGAKGGFMTIGGYNISTHLSPLQSFPMHNDQNYQLKFQGITISNHTVYTPENTYAVLTSGTSYVYLQTDILNQFWSYFTRFCSEDWKCGGGKVTVRGEPHACYIDNRVKMADFYASFPVIYIDFEGGSVEWRPESYLFTYSNLPNRFCIGVYDSGYHGKNYFGALFMRGHDVIFNRTGRSISFAQSNCDPEQVISTRKRRLQEGISTENESSCWAFCVILVGVGCVGVTSFALIRRKNRH